MEITCLGRSSVCLIVLKIIVSKIALDNFTACEPKYRIMLMVHPIGKNKIVLMKNKIALLISLKDYYEIVNEARPLSGFFPTDADLFTEMHF